MRFLALCVLFALISGCAAPAATTAPEAAPSATSPARPAPTVESPESAYARGYRDGYARASQDATDAAENATNKPRTIVEDRRLDLAANVGAWGMQPFVLSNAARVEYDLFESKQNGVDVCIIADGHRAAWERGEAILGWACHENALRQTDSQTLPDGTYYLALRTSHALGASALITIRLSPA